MIAVFSATRGSRDREVNSLAIATGLSWDCLNVPIASYNAHKTPIDFLNRLSNMLNSHSLARYMEESGKEYQPWLLIQLRLQKLRERRASLSTDQYLHELTVLHQDLMNLGEWWVGRDDEVFGHNS
ncbi:MAG: hypothetical protein ACFE0J_15275 [Elainellaceae cyanobacterium]